MRAVFLKKSMVYFEKVPVKLDALYLYQPKFAIRMPLQIAKLYIVTLQVSIYADQWLDGPFLCLQVHNCADAYIIHLRILLHEFSHDNIGFVSTIGHEQ